LAPGEGDGLKGFDKAILVKEKERDGFLSVGLIREIVF